MLITSIDDLNAHSFQFGIEALSDASASSVRQLFDKYCDFKVDARFCRNIVSFDVGFVTKNSDHVNFFGSPLLGVYPARWTDDERNRWVDDILQADEIALKEDLYELPAIDRNFLVTSDLVNLSFVYVTHRILTESSVPASVRQKAAESTINIMHYKFITSIMAHYFRYPADEAVAKAAYNALSMKFDIKRAGSWGALVKMRSASITKRGSLHYETMMKMRDDKGVTYMVSDIQTRIREVIKAQTQVFYEVRDNNGKIVSTSSLMKTDEGVAVKDVRRTFNELSRYMDQVIRDPSDFIRKDLFKVILDVNPSAAMQETNLTLNYISANYTESKKKYIKTMVDETILYSLNFIREKKLRTNDLGTILLRLRSMFTGSKINDSTILKIRELGDRAVRESIRRSKSIPVSPERTAILLYIVMRALTKRHYS